MTIRKTPNIKGGLLARLPVKFLLYAAALIFLASAGAWWYHDQNSPDRMFWGMLRSSLSTTGFSRTVTQEESQQQLEQIVQVRTSPYHLANGRSTITQGDPATTRVVTESIGTPSTDYVRYTQIQTAQKGASGNELDFSKVINVWGATESVEGTTSGQLYNESVLGVIPFGSLNSTQQDALIKQMQTAEVYKFELISVERSGWLRRPLYTFSVQVNPQAYIAALKTFADELGLTHLKTVDPEQYQSARPVTVEIDVDGWSRQVTQVSYGSGSRVEKFGSLNSVRPLQSAPRDTVPIGELQLRLQTVQ